MKLVKSAFSARKGSQTFYVKHEALKEDMDAVVYARRKRAYGDENKEEFAETVIFPRDPSFTIEAIFFEEI